MGTIHRHGGNAPIPDLACTAIRCWNRVTGKEDLRIECVGDHDVRRRDIACVAQCQPVGQGIAGLDRVRTVELYQFQHRLLDILFDRRIVKVDSARAEEMAFKADVSCALRCLVAHKETGPSPWCIPCPCVKDLAE